MLQSTVQAANYTMDNSTAPTTTVGMQLVVGNAPESFLIEDFRRIKVLEAASGALLQVHYFGGRDI